MKHNTSVFILIAAILVSAYSLNAQSYAEDTVWTKVTDQVQGFWKVKFSDNDSIIVGNGYEYTIFYNSLNGEEITRFPGKSSIFFIDNDNKFIRTDASRKKYEIYDTKTLQLIDTLINDGISSSASIDISKDDKYLLTNIPYGFRIFDLETKQILRTRTFPNEPNLIYSVVDYVFFVCDNRNFIAHRVRTYEDPNHPGDDKYYKTYGDYSLYNFNSFDSIGTFINARGMKRSNNCIYYAIATGDPTYGVEIYDFNTKQLLHKLPINGPSLRVLEFSPDDKYLITNPNIMIWDILTGAKKYTYTSGSTNCLAVSHDGIYLFSTVGEHMYKWFFRNSPTSIYFQSTFEKLLFPNPTSGEVNIKLDKPDSFGAIKHIQIFNLKGEFVYEPNIQLLSDDEFMTISVSQLANGEYIIVIEGNETETYKLIINK